MKQNIVIATIKSVNIQNFRQLCDERYNFILITQKDELNAQNLNHLKPEFIFFPHWSWIIPPEIYENFNCVIFHTSDLPFGRGGSPIQNLITRGIYKTKITALKAVQELDAGDVYLKCDVDLSDGNMDEILTRISDVIFTKMIPQIIAENIVATPQIGEAVSFKRRTPAQSDLATLNKPNLRQIYDFVRMLDGEGYPRAFLQIDGYKIELSKAKFQDGKITGRFEINEK
ncbi:Methionyl-tRNA formyltransferase [Campylobacter majalis]|uniref:Methionyl-tRNA formyltransferase n=1 Tax=Campylobacter majalis TaxID=2790656 RepID=A0ABN7KAW8_9BACT|nr:formyltransferase family protein [Campylobacter majalis]CAD7288025.1 Methionyl-tRNA formyltransferase [Campylobacter majalis]